MRGPSGFIIECVKDGKRRLVEAHGKPGNRAGLGENERACIRKECRDLFFPTGLSLRST
jgi:hypothetical protein